ncbi:MAG: hypothetical protein GWN84_15830 [Gammaproteobacteria bacterium]|nr:hypothetical protein [Gammaproteobacteria bacterium]NIR84253.1 hypothetical protein [Gammaproteobacteria bacterium]NIR89723.1 hypothetical protein [Gammaproteobacteria bacterium]NIU05411.1 hypothetical protein [Gammaproteobacteria bacterium]NIV52357.1 hypothetical protein [Gammaproteobacteria bacterium]
MKTAFLRIVYATFVVFGGAYLYVHRESLDALSAYSVLTLIVLSALFHIGVAANALQLSAVGHFYKRDISLPRAYAINLVYGYYNLLVPFKGAVALKGYVLNNIYGLSYLEYLGAMLLTGLTVVVGSLTAILLGAVLSNTGLGLEETITGGANTGKLWILAIVLFCVAGLALFMNKEKLDGFAGTARAKLELLTSSKVWIISLSSYAMFVSASAARLAILGASVGSAGVSVWPSLLVANVLALVRLVAITPGNVGVREAVIVVLGEVMGLGHQEALAVALGDRAIMVLNQIASGSILHRRVLSWMKDAG